MAESEIANQLRRRGQTTASYDRYTPQEFGSDVKNWWQSMNPLQQVSMAPIPVVSDLAGVAGDVQMYAEQPETRSFGNYALSAAGLLPFVPAAASIRGLGKADDISDAVRNVDDFPTDEEIDAILDMSTDARMQRARDMGFDVDNPVYHGTAADIDEFNPEMFGSSTDAYSARQGVWMTDDPYTARSYAEYSATNKPVMDKLAEADAAEARGDWDAYDKALIEAEQLEKEIYQEPNRGQNIIPINVSGDYMELDMGGAEYMDVQDDITEAIAQAQNEGYQGVKLRNLSDDAGMNNRPATHVLTFDPSNIRSVNAAFDPAKRDSGNLLAGVGALTVPGLLTAQMLRNREDEEMM